MIYTLYFKDKALKDLAYHKNQVIHPIKKLQGLLQELETHPYEGTGQLAPLKYELSGLGSRVKQRTPPDLSSRRSDPGSRYFISTGTLLITSRA